MNRRKIARISSLCGAGIAALGIAWFAQQHSAQAADHSDPPNRVGAAVDAADIADLYAWHSDDGQNLSVVLTFAGPVAPAADQAGMYDPDVLYGVHIDNSGSNDANFDIWVRFAQNDLGDWGVQVTNLPGEAAPVVGPVDTTIDAPNGAKVYTGLHDDPFFFDLEGFEMTLMNGSLEFDNTRDSFAGQNVTAIVLEMPLSALSPNDESLSIWTTSSRI